jgi:hypothetical protein
MFALAFLIASSLPAQQRPAPRHRAYSVSGWFWSGALYFETYKVSEYRQPPVYATWWREIAACEELPVPNSAQQASVQFFVVASNYFALDRPGTMAMLAGTYIDEPSVYMGLPYVWEEGVVKHEMLHLLLHWAKLERPGDDHPPEYFETCGIHTIGHIHN